MRWKNPFKQTLNKKWKEKKKNTWNSFKIWEMFPSVAILVNISNFNSLI